MVSVYDQSIVHVFEIDVNTVAEPRSATIQFCGNSTCIPLTVNQAAAAFDYQLSVDTEKKKISLGYRKAQDNPWNNINTKYN